MRRFFDWLEVWVFGDDNAFIGVGKLILVITVAGFILLAPAIYWITQDDNSAFDKCVRAGNGWAIIGQHRGAKGIIYTDYGCVEVRRP